MSGLHDRVFMVGLGWVLAALPVAGASGQALSICEIQSNTSDGDASVYDWATYEQLVHCAGGIVVANLDRSVPRLLLQDPACPGGWGGIQVKDRWDAGAFDQVQVGDWVVLTNMEVEEHRGTTFLQWYASNDPTLEVTSKGNPVPPPILVSVSDIPAPVYDPVEDTWFVDNHDAEPYESMRLTVRDVTLVDMGLGKATDNYVLQDSGTHGAWAADYLNVDKEPPWAEYHEFVIMDQQFCLVSGVLEQYTKLSDDFDYYQLLTLETADLIVWGDGNSDGAVDINDVLRFDECLMGPVCDEAGGCDPPAWTGAGLDIQDCLMMDFDYDGDVDLFDFGELQRSWGDP